jgi:hypothetical protein
MQLRPLSPPLTYDLFYSLLQLCNGIKMLFVLTSQEINLKMSAIDDLIVPHLE